MNGVKHSLANLCIKITDGSHNPPKGIDYSEHIMLSSKNVLDDCIHLDKPRYLSEEDFQKENNRTDVNPGDVLLTIVGTVGRVAVVDNSLPKFTLQRSVAVLKPNEERVSSRFLMYSLQAILEELLGEARGVAQKGIYLRTLRAMEIYIPAHPEQKRIVAILDKAFAEIEQARANTEQNLKNARELFESYLQQVFSQRGEEWQTFRLLEVVKLKSGTTIKKDFEKDSGDVAYIKVAGMTLAGNEVGITTSEKFLDNKNIRTSNILPIGTTIFPKRGGAIGTNKKRITQIPLCVDLNIMGAIPDTSKVLPMFIFNFFKTFDLLSISNGTTIPQINNYSFDSLEISLPNLEEQETLVDRISNLEKEYFALAELYNKKLEAIHELKKSLLQKAFSGELTKIDKGVAA